MPVAKNKFFLGGVSHKGFQTHFYDEIKKPCNFTYILKGGAGTGKSTLMKAVAKHFSEKDDITLYFCASDPNSLDAVLLKKAEIIIVDGTSPHVFDPVYPGVCQKIINLGEYWDDEVLTKSMTEIIKATDENQRWHKRCRNFVGALSSLYADTAAIGQDALNSEKLTAFSERMSAKLLPKKKTLSEGKTEFSQLSALTPNGYVTLTDTIDNYPQKYILNDLYFAGSDQFLRDFATMATLKGYDIVVSECTVISPITYEHLLIPELGLALISATPVNDNEIIDAKPVNFMRFYEKAVLSHKKQRLAFNRKACDEIICEAITALSNAKSVHDEIEAYYIDAMDFEKVTEYTQKLIDSISRLY